jgi:hypothetical protein
MERRWRSIMRRTAVTQKGVTVRMSKSQVTSENLPLTQRMLTWQLSSRSWMRTRENSLTSSPLYPIIDLRRTLRRTIVVFLKLRTRMKRVWWRRARERQW